MQLRDALDDYKRHAGDGTRFPGERRTVAGRCAGGGGRLGHVGDDEYESYSARFEDY